jgi:hypothetical protein
LLFFDGVPSGRRSRLAHRWLKPPALIPFPFGEPGTPKGLCRKAGDFSHRNGFPSIPSPEGTMSKYILLSVTMNIISQTYG